MKSKSVITITTCQRDSEVEFMYLQVQRIEVASCFLLKHTTRA